MATELRTTLRTYIRKVNNGLKSFLADRTPSALYSYAQYQIGLCSENFKPLKSINGGKRIRSAIPMLVASYFRQDGYALYGAMSLELFHNFTLIIDDIQDGDTIRRGRPTLWKLVGVPQALNTGMILQTLSNEAAMKACNHLPNSEFSHWLDSYLHLTGRVFEGQHLDISYESKNQVFTAEYIRMAMAKTAVLIGQSFAQSFSLHPKEEVRKLASTMRQIGESAGMAFQIQDDILGLWGDKKKTGKPVASDLRKHKKTLPIVHALENGSRSAKKLILDSFKGDVSDDEAITILKQLKQIGSYDYAQSQVREYTHKALAGLEQVDIDKRLKERLKLIIELLSNRSS
jgi:geranylgeranyl diphosphate synthase, type I